MPAQYLCIYIPFVLAVRIQFEEQASAEGVVCYLRLASSFHTVAMVRAPGREAIDASLKSLV